MKPRNQIEPLVFKPDYHIFPYNEQLNFKKFQQNFKKFHPQVLIVSYLLQTCLLTIISK